MAEQKGPQGNTLKEITQFIARQKVSGTPVERIVHQLVQRGWPEPSARQFVANVQVDVAQRGVERSDVDERRAALRHYRRRALRGSVCIILGVVLTVVGLQVSDVYKGLYYFAMGVLLCIFGTIDFVSGVTGWWRNRG